MAQNFYTVVSYKTEHTFSLIISIYRSKRKTDFQFKTTSIFFEGILLLPLRL